MVRAEEVRAKLPAEYPSFVKRMLQSHVVKAQASSCDDLLIWKKALESFELLGMNVAFLLKRINDLLGLPADGLRDLLECQKYRELKSERARAEEKVEALQLTLSNVKGVLQKMDMEMEEIELSVKRSGVTLQQLAAAPW
ncbi:unnamed protein product [Urochloa humidicola]